MKRHTTGTRALMVTALVPLALAFGGTAFADPGSGNGHSASAPGQEKKQASTSPTTDSTASQGSSDHSQGNASTTGSYDQPQPYSNADQNNTGANDTSSSNPYKSTRDGSASGNGNGNGKATGKPCAGCVGKADNKNPKGQAPNGSDHNAGYECDRNHGIGRTNPAHTGCKSTPPPPPTCEQTHNCPPNDCKTAGTCPPCQGASCQPGCEQTDSCSQQPPSCNPATSNCTTSPPVCNPTTDSCGSQPPTVVKAVHHSRVPTTVVSTQTQLPFTGLNMMEMLYAALLMLAAGSGLLLKGRRPRRMHN